MSEYLTLALRVFSLFFCLVVDLVGLEMLLLLLIVLVIFLLRRFSPQIYDFVIVKMTSLWYKEVLSRLPVGAKGFNDGER